MKRLLLLLAGCVQFDPPVAQPAPPPPVKVGIEETTCHLAPPYDGKLKWPSITSFTALYCTTKNEIGDTREVCFQPYVAVRQTGALYTSHDIVCSNTLVEGESQTLPVQLDMRRELCELDHGGCIIRAITLRGAEEPDPDTVVALARGFEALAPMPGRDRPTVTECDALAASWIGKQEFYAFQKYTAHPNAVITACLGMSRAELACLQAAPDARVAVACAPRLP